MIEYEANWAAATWLMAEGLWGRQKIDLVLLTLENSQGIERPPGQAGQLVACLEGEGLY